MFHAEDEKKDKKDNDTPIAQKLFERRTIIISEGINSTVAQRVIAELIAMDYEDPKKPITIFLNSPGGEVSSGFGIYDTMRFIQAEVRVVVTGLSASIATVIMLGAKKEHRVSLPNSRFLIHQPLIAGHIQGHATDIEITAQQIENTRKKIAELYHNETGKPVEEIQKHIERDYWMSAEECIEYGLISKIVSSIKEVS